MHYDWLEAGEHMRRTVVQLSQQLRRFLNDQAWLENCRIMALLHSIEAQALALREQAPAAADIELPMERPLHTPPHKPFIAEVALQADAKDIDGAALSAGLVVDKAQLTQHIRLNL